MGILVVALNFVDINQMTMFSWLRVNEKKKNAFILSSVSDFDWHI